MKLTAQVQLLPTVEQAAMLRQTLLVANEAANYVSQRAWEAREFHPYGLSALCYHDVRQRFSLGANITVRVITKAAHAYRKGRTVRRVFSPLGSAPYSDRLVSWKESEVSIWTMVGRQRIPFVCGEVQRTMLENKATQYKLALVRGKWFLLVACEVEEAAPLEAKGALGIDLGIRNIAVDSDGDIHSASHLLNVRHRHQRRRDALQRRGTRSAKRRLRQHSGKETRFARDTNHVISKRIVAKAEGTQCAIALEDLKGIREGVTVRRSQRDTLHSWSFNQLREFVTYKALRAGVPLVLVDPRNTSRTCPSCGLIDKKNRRSQERFACVSCGFAGHADTVAAGNIARRAIAGMPNVAALAG